MSKVILITSGMLRQEVRSVRVIMGYLLGLTLLAMGLNDFLGYTIQIKEPVNILEAFIVTANQSMAGRFWVTGYLLVIADAPFVKGNTCMILYRSGRRVWNMGMVSYVLVQAFLYTVSFAVLSVAVSIPYGFSGRLWSSPVYLLAANTSEAIAEKYHLYFEGMAMMRYMTVMQAFGITWLYMFCYLAFIGVLLYVCSFVPGGFWGLVAAAAVHLGGVFISLFAALPWCPVHYIDGAGSHWRYPCIFLALILIMTIVSLSAIGSVDIPARTGGGV
ncbi:MAG: hypothetical protein K2I96_02965 [Lachnospiraceae bacterium]|nr:hypothetical protein [Lachnospiraceae bacterium]